MPFIDKMEPRFRFLDILDAVQTLRTAMVDGTLTEGCMIVQHVIALDQRCIDIMDGLPSTGKCPKMDKVEAADTQTITHGKEMSTQ